MVVRVVVRDMRLAMAKLARTVTKPFDSRLAQRSAVVARAESRTWQKFGHAGRSRHIIFQILSHFLLCEWGQESTRPARLFAVRSLCERLMWLE